jgi:hypothetical protein
MKKVLCRVMPILAIALVVALSGAAFAQVAGTPTNPYPKLLTNYFSNNTTTGAPDATLRYTEHYGGPLASGQNLCANIYVFDAGQEPVECCSCPVTPNGLVTASVRALTSNPIFPGGAPPDGVIEIIASLGTPEGGSLSPSNSGCDATFGAIGNGGFTGVTVTFSQMPYIGIDAWVTHIQNKITGASGNAAYPETETAFDSEALTSGEFSELAFNCAFIRTMGSGHGTCDSACGTEF